jgi:hypothetical protein
MLKATVYHVYVAWFDFKFCIELLAIHYDVVFHTSPDLNDIVKSK